MTEVLDDQIDHLDPPDVPEGDRDDGGDGPWVTVRTFWEPLRAHMAQIRLDDAQIESVLLDENLVAMDWLMANAVGGIKLQVRVTDAQRASDILGEQSGQRTPMAVEHRAAQEASSEAITVCPRCGSDEIYRDNPWRRPMMILLLGAIVASLGVLLLLMLPWHLRAPVTWRCLRCGHEWPATRRGFPVSA